MQEDAISSLLSVFPSTISVYCTVQLHCPTEEVQEEVFNNKIRGDWKYNFRAARNFECGWAWGKYPQSLPRRLSRLLMGEKNQEQLWLLTKTCEFINCEKYSTEKIRNSDRKKQPFIYYLSFYSMFKTITAQKWTLFLSVLAVFWYQLECLPRFS